MVEDDSIKTLERFLDDLKESSVKSKEYYKFIIGLSTGTLVFSITFLKEFVTFPEYKFILIIGWFCLLTSIIAGVLVLPKIDDLHAYFQYAKNLFGSKETLAPIIRKELQEHYLKSLIKSYVDPIVKDHEKEKVELYEFLEKLPAKGLKKYFERLQLIRVKDPKTISFIKEFLEETFKILSLTKMIERYGNPSFILKRIRKSLFQLIWLNRLMKYAFFVGIFAISVFSIINFLR